MLAVNEAASADVEIMDIKKRYLEIARGKKRELDKLAIATPGATVTPQRTDEIQIIGKLRARAKEDFAALKPGKRFEQA
jgi:hypothetical protein